MFSNQLLRISKSLKTVQAGIFIRLPTKYKKFFPHKTEDPSPPHITVLYIGDIPESSLDNYRKVIEVACSLSTVRECELKNLNFFKNQEGQWIAHNPVVCEGLEDFRNRVWNACEALGLTIMDSFPKFKPHATIAYLDQKKYDAPTAQGKFKPKYIELWYDDKVEKFKLNP